MTVNFKKGTFQLHSDPNFNYQLNRTYLWSNGDINDLKKIAPKIVDEITWKNEFLKLAQKSLEKNHIEEASAYYRMAEFFMYDGDKDKLFIYERAVKLFYDFHKELFEKNIIYKENIPYRNGYLPIIYTIPESKIPVDTIILHGGYDSYMEEFLPMLLYLRENNFAVYLFEGPGQGGVLRKEKMPFNVNWDEPVKAVLNFYNLTDVTIVGLSLGAILAARAAAFEKRIKRVVAWSACSKLFDILLYALPQKEQVLLKKAINNKDANSVNNLFENLMNVNAKINWAIKHGMYNMGVNSIYEYIKKIIQFQYTDVSDRINQDFLLIGATKDHFIPAEFALKIIDTLTNVRSMTYRLFTEKEGAENHCNAGNTKIVLDTIISWIKTLKNQYSTKEKYSIK